MARDNGPTVDAPDHAAHHPDHSIDEAASLGLALRHARAQSGKTLAILAAETKVNARFLTALEQNDWSSLPSRVFAVGYVRAYAGALGLDEQLAVERFKRESPDTSVPLKAPVGIAFEDVKRNTPRIMAGVIIAAVAIVGWNVFQRISRVQAPHPSDIATLPNTWAQGAASAHEMDLGAPRAAPQDQTTPAPYITRGLEAELTGVDPNDPASGDAAPAPAATVQKAFNPRGAVYGAPANASQVVIQAKKPGAFVVRMGSDRVLFARQMAAGEAWRAPLGVSATIDVSDPTAFDVYLNGELGGALPALQTSLAQLNARAGQANREASAPAPQPRPQVAAPRPVTVTSGPRPYTPQP
ncbi:helix-turn-helix domain-containing protein [Brevundimonas nasdae]|uniref:Helix-turn-helix domain-containing protein n=1 Tax=Brevundimonas nasdae TaxID=172043 RepID=A0ABX8TK95_9CAUL|nr:helix-turn-helix domain-containing protein [Brevundimonas nasdae]QYC10200.1 helix-turn-helix domain-containing protein [Brevundimonas nasdae]QYC12989.1 helix-turn-helix domain-containing protein [Brevundimonas nasdae]